jgi:DNA segregation ATPase FtsK/SpoIIIE-like protein
MNQLQVMKFGGTFVGDAVCIRRTVEIVTAASRARRPARHCGKPASTSFLQRRLKIGYGRAAAILDSMERQGLIGPIDGAKPRQVLGRTHELVSDWDEQGF